MVRQPGSAMSVTPLPLTAAQVAAAPVDDVLRSLAAELPDMSAIRRVMRKRHRARDVRVEYVPPGTDRYPVTSTDAA